MVPEEVAVLIRVQSDCCASSPEPSSLEVHVLRASPLFVRARFWPRCVEPVEFKAISIEKSPGCEKEGRGYVRASIPTFGPGFDGACR